MDAHTLYRLLRTADSYEEVAWEVRGHGALWGSDVTLYKVTDTVFDEVEVMWYVVRHGNPDEVVASTSDPVEAFSVYVREAKRARREQGERTMWRR